MKTGQLISTFLVGTLVGAGAVYALVPRSSGGQPPVLNPGRVEVLREGNTQPDVAGKAKYANAHYGFSLIYPDALGVNEIPASEDAMTVVFQKPGAEEGFQIFIVPYPDSQISKERIQKDLRGAPMKNVTEIVLAGNVKAVHFNSQAPVIGESSEVWFIHGGYLFEVTTYANQDAQLAVILATLQFTK